MALYETDAILLAVKDWGDADRMVTLFSHDYGKITAIAYGARLPRNNLSGPLQTFSYVTVGMSSGRQLDYIKQCQVNNSFKAVREDLVIMAYALFISEIVIELWPERENDQRVFELLLLVFQVLTQRNPRIVSLAAAWQLLVLAGYQPLCDTCVVCGNDIVFPAYFSFEPCGVVCQHCVASPQQALYSEDVFCFINQLLCLDWIQPQHFSVTKKTLLLTEKLLYDVLACIIGKPLKSVAFLASL